MVVIVNLLKFIGGLEILFELLMVTLCTLWIFVGLAILCNMMLDSYVCSWDTLWTTLWTNVWSKVPCRDLCVLWGCLMNSMLNLCVVWGCFVRTYVCFKLPYGLMCALRMPYGLYVGLMCGLKIPCKELCVLYGCPMDCMFDCSVL
jgi:hypothetical protein